MVDYYNHTPHIALKLDRRIFTPEEVEFNKDLEGLFIRRNKERCEVVEEEQKEKGLFNYVKGNVLMVHLDLSRTPYRFVKRRRRFNALAIFMSYEHGNVKCVVFKSGIGLPHVNIKTLKDLKAFDVATYDSPLQEDEDENNTGINTNMVRPIVVPIYYTKFVCDDIEELMQSVKYKRYNYFF
jgi:hypothetical protein